MRRSPAALLVGATALLVRSAAQLHAQPPATPGTATSKAVLPQVGDAEIGEGLAIGAQSREFMGVVTGGASTGFAGALCRAATPEGVCGVEIYVQGPVGRIALLASGAKKKYLPFTADSVPAEAKWKALYIRAVPVAPHVVAGRMMQAPSVTHIVVRPRGGDDASVIQPVLIMPETMNWGNALGATYSGEGQVALFDLAKLPEGDLEIDVVTSGKEARVAVKSKDRSKLR